MALRWPRVMRPSTRWIPALALVVGVAAVAVPLVPGGAEYADRTAAGEAWREQGFSVAVVWPKTDGPSFMEGATLAWEQVDRTPGPLAGKIRLRRYHEPLTPNEGGVAAAVARDGRVMAVLGHAIAEHIVPAALVYERHAIVFLTTEATDPRSTSHQLQYVFSLTPDDTQIAEALSEYATSVGIKRIGLLHARNAHGESAARQFVAKHAEYGLGLAFVRSYPASTRAWPKQDFRPLIAEIQRESFDALLVADELPRAGKLIRDLDEMHVTQPVLATDKMDSAELAQIAGASAHRVHVASPFDASSTTPAFARFRQAFEARYKVPPTYAAAQGYEAFMLVANASLASRTAAPLVLATTIRLSPGWPGLFGTVSFRPEGDVVGRRIAIKRLVDGASHTVYSTKGSDK